MNLIQMIRLTDSVPNNALLNDGTKLTLEINQRNDKSFCAALWCLVNGRQDHIYAYGTGNTSEAAKKDLKEKLLTPNI